MPGRDTPTDVSSRAGHSERQALAEAVAALKATPWPEVEKTPLTTRMVSVLFGAEHETTGVTRDDALQAYVADATLESRPAATVIAHADTTLAAARQVAETGRSAAQSVNPDTDDVAALEGAINDIRFSRDMYLSALKRLEDDGHDIPMGQADIIRAAFSQTIEDIGSTADIVAARAAALRQQADLGEADSVER